MTCDRLVDTDEICRQISALQRVRTFSGQRRRRRFLFGAHPTASVPGYGIDVDHLGLYCGNWNNYRARFVDLPDHASYLEAVGGATRVRGIARSGVLKNHPMTDMTYTLAELCICAAAEAWRGAGEVLATGITLKPSVLQGAPALQSHESGHSTAGAWNWGSTIAGLRRPRCPPAQSKFQDWLAGKQHGEMAWLERSAPKRIDQQKVGRVQKASSVWRQVTK